MNHLASVGHQRFADDFVGGLGGEREEAVQVFQESGDVGGKHLAGMIGGVRGNIGGSQDLHALMDHSFAGLSQFAVASANSGEIHDDGTGLHGFDHGLGDQNGGALSGHGRGGDDDVVLANDLKHQFALAAVEIFVHGFGVAAFVFGLVGGSDVQ